MVTSIVKDNDGDDNDATDNDDDDDDYARTTR